MSLKFSRIQFTPDLMPMDITGTDILQDAAGGRREFQFVHGPVFANIVLADEINRAPPKTQAAMLEAMQEQNVTVRRQGVPARAAVPGAGHAEPGRAGGDVSAARGPARPVHVPDRAGLPVGGRGDPDRPDDDRRRPARARPSAARPRTSSGTRTSSAACRCPTISTRTPPGWSARPGPNDSTAPGLAQAAGVVGGRPACRAVPDPGRQGPRGAARQLHGAAGRRPGGRRAGADAPR